MLQIPRCPRNNDHLVRPNCALPWKALHPFLSTRRLFVAQFVILQRDWRIAEIRQFNPLFDLVVAGRVVIHFSNEQGYIFCAAAVGANSHMPTIKSQIDRLIMTLSIKLSPSIETVFGRDGLVNYSNKPILPFVFAL